MDQNEREQIQNGENPEKEETNPETKGKSMKEVAALLVGAGKTAAKAAGKSAAKAAGNAKNAVVNAIDANDDGKFDLKDLSFVAAQFGEKREADRAKKEFDALQPIFQDTVTSPEFTLPKLIRVAQMDKKHEEAECCQDSIGFRAEHGGIQIITIYPGWTKLLNLDFYPNANSELFYVDPCDRDKYIALEQYFNYLRVSKVGELQMIAQSLGAKHFKVSYVEQESADSENKVNAMVAMKGKATPSGSGEIDHEKSSSSFLKVSVGAEMEFLGHDPIEPTLKYLKGDPNIETLIKMRMSNNAPIHQRTIINLVSSSEISEKDAAKIDGAMSALHYGGKLAIQKQAQKESRTTLEYEIDY